ncbi:MAG TPA: hypothetical protein VFZ83_06250 [Acidimicrobiia bacterium]|nr:hypothetical protein [Acidimicrobiia bacterium]
MTSSTTPEQRPRTIRRIVAVAVAGATLGVTGAVAVAVAQDDSTATEACGPTGSDLRLAADAARQLEAQAPELFEQSPRPAAHGDLRLAAEWSDRLAALDADGNTACTP